MLRKIEYLIPAALDAVDTVLAGKYGRDNIPSGYQSAISGFGTSLLQMGLLPTLAVYTDNDNAAGIQRDVLLQTLFVIVLHQDSRFSAESKRQIPTDENGLLQTRTLLRTVANPNFKQDELKEHLMQAALAFKLAIRTYNLKKS